MFSEPFSKRFIILPETPSTALLFLIKGAITPKKIIADN
jgi:hypothetical protein